MTAAMNSPMFNELLDLACGALLLTAAATLWRHNLVAIVRLTAAQAIALAAVAVLVATPDMNGALYGLAAVIVAINGDQPKETNGSGTPVMGNTPRTAPMFTKACTTTQQVTPAASS